MNKPLPLFYPRPLRYPALRRRANPSRFMIVQDDYCSPPRLELRPVRVNGIVACVLTAREHSRIP